MKNATEPSFGLDKLNVDKIVSSKVRIKPFILKNGGLKSMTWLAEYQHPRLDQKAGILTA